MNDGTLTLPDDYTRRKEEIEQYVSILQRLPEDVRWICAGAQNAVQARSQATSTKVGRWEWRARRLLRVANAVGLGTAIVAAVNVALCVRLYLSQIRRRAGAAPVALFVGIRALRESALYEHFKQVASEPVGYIDERDMAEFFRFGHVSASDLFRELACSWRETLNPARLPPSFSAHDVQTVVLMRGHQYAFMRAWFKRHLKSSNGRTLVGCTAAGLASHAAVTAGAKTIYMVHGFQRHSLVYPDFAECFCFTAIEAVHLGRRIPRARVELRHEWQPFLETSRVVAIAGVETDPNPECIRPFIDWALQNDLPVVVRPHPADGSGYWDRWRQIEGVTVLEPIGRFDEFLAAVRPRVLATWYSTALHDAFVKGIVPVTVSPVDDDVLDTVFPFYDISLRWPADSSYAAKLVESGPARAEFFKQRRKFVTGAELASEEPPMCLVNAAEAPR